MLIVNLYKLFRNRCRVGILNELDIKETFSLLGCLNCVNYYVTDCVCLPDVILGDVNSLITSSERPAREACDVSQLPAEHCDQQQRAL